jgi:hypothetical protein
MDWAIGILALICVVVGCGTDRDHGDGDTDAPRTESVLDPFVGAVDRAHGAERVADGHNAALDAALRDAEPRKENRR